MFLMEVRPASGQVDDLLGELRRVIGRGERALVTTLTKRMAEELTDYLAEQGLKVRYLHSDVQTIERVRILQALRRGEFDVLVGINLLREGLDLPEVSLVAILDADREGFLRSTRSLIQTAGRAARNLDGKVLLYADQATDSLRRAMEETARRRAAQEEYNREHASRPRESRNPSGPCCPPSWRRTTPRPRWTPGGAAGGPGRAAQAPGRLRKEMLAAAEALRFEEAAALRDRIRELEKEELKCGGETMRESG